MSKDGPAQTDENPLRFYRVPTAVIKAWDRGEYFTGAVQSLAYKYLGVALQLRGLYTYRRDDKTGDDFKGVAKIELVGGREMVMEGIRLYADDKPDIKFWRTEFSHFLSDSKIIWTYRLFDCECDEQLLQYLTGNKLDASPGPDDNFGIPDVNWKELQQFLLREDFNKSLRAAEAKCDDEHMIKIMLHFELQDDEDQSIKAQYRQLKSIGEDITGDSLFKRIRPQKGA